MEHAYICAAISYTTRSEKRKYSGIIKNEALSVNPLRAELNPICHLLALLEAHHILHVSRIRVNSRRSFEVRHPRCVGSITKETLCTTQAV